MKKKKQKMKYNIIVNETEKFTAGKLKKILENVSDDTIICYNEDISANDRDIFGNIFIRGFIKLKHQFGDRKSIEKIIFTPYETEEEK